MTGQPQMSEAALLRKLSRRLTSSETSRWHETSWGALRIGEPNKGRAFAHLDSVGREQFLLVVARGTKLLARHGYTEVAIKNTFEARPTVTVIPAEGDMVEAPEEQRLGLIQHAADMVLGII